MDWEECDELKGQDRGAYATKCLARVPTARDLAQPDGTTCGPTCVTYLRLGGAEAPNGQVPTFHGIELNQPRMKWLTSLMRKRVSAKDDGPGTLPEDVERLLCDFAPAWNKRLDRWHLRTLDYEGAGSAAAWLDLNTSAFVSQLGSLLAKSPRGVACSFLISADGAPASECKRWTSHWVVALKIEEGQEGHDVLYYDPNAQLAFHVLKASAREFLAAHVKGYNSRKRSGLGYHIRFDGHQDTKVVAAERDRYHKPIKKGSSLFQLDPSSWPFDGQDLEAADKPSWFSDPTEADAAAAAGAKGSRSMAVIEYGEHRGRGAFAVVPIAQTISAANAREGELDADDSPALSRSDDGRDLSVGPLRCGSLKVFFPTEDDPRTFWIKGGKSHRRLKGDPGA